MLMLDALTRILPAQALARRFASEPGDEQFKGGLALGQRLRATVEASLADGEFQVLVANQPLRMQLPAGAHAGQVLDLVFVAREPRPTFALVGYAPSAESPTALSESGRFIDALLHQDLAPGEATASKGTAPLIGAPPVDTTRLADSLRRAVSESGLFYESHQAQWVAGERSLAELLREPQGRLSVLQSPGTDAEGPVPSSLRQPGAEAPDSTQEPVHASVLPLLRHQLESLETRHFAWHGEVWSGQTLEWEVTEQPAQEHGLEQPANWQTRLRLTLPRLGEVSALLALSTDGLIVRLRASHPNAAQVLSDGTAKLTQGLEASGIKVLGMGVNLDDPA